MTRTGVGSARRGALTGLCLIAALVLPVESAAADGLDLVSRAAGATGVKGDLRSVTPAISADGRFVAFYSEARNLHPDDSDIVGDVFVRDVQANTVTLASRATGATGAKSNHFATEPELSADGRVVVFGGRAADLDPDDVDDRLDVYARDLQANTTTLVSRATGTPGAKGNSDSFQHALAANGRFVAFTSGASNLHPDDPDGNPDVYVRDLQANTTALVSRASGAAGDRGNTESFEPAISADGRFVAFVSYSTNLSPDDADTEADVFVRDLQANTTTLVSRATGATGDKSNDDSFTPAISADGQVVSFQTGASNLDPDDSDAISDVFVRDLQANTTTLVSRAAGSGGAKGNGNSLVSALAADGRVVMYGSRATNLHPDDVDDSWDVFVRDVQASTTTLVSRAAGAVGAKGNGNSFVSAITDDARFVVFSSAATNLHPDDRDDTQDVFRRDLLPAPPTPPTVAEPSPTSIPAPVGATPGPRASAAMRLRVPSLSVIGRSGSQARCRMRVGQVRSCTVRLRADGRVVARGSARSRRGNATRVAVTLRLTRAGRALLARHLGGIRARARARAATSGGPLRASARTRAILRVERLTTPPGAWIPDTPALSARGERFVRSLRGRLTAVAGLRCDGHSANVRGTVVSSGALSLARAAAMCDALRALGVRVRPQLAGHGNARPIASNASPSGRAENRRVEVTLTH